MSIWSFLKFQKARSKNLRRFQRVRIPLLVRYQLEEEGEGKVSNLNDLAAGGIRFTTEEPVRLGLRLRLKVKLPWRERPLVAIGKVTRCVKVRGTQIYRVATQFVGMKKEEISEVESFVDALANEREKLRRDKIKLSLKKAR
jgi:hypothetical protein